MDEKRIDRDSPSDLGDDSPMSHEHSDREEEEQHRETCASSDEGVNFNSLAMDHDVQQPAESDTEPTFPTNPALNMLSMMGLPNLPNFANFPNTEVLEKIQMQLRDLQAAGLLDREMSSESSAQAAAASQQNDPESNSSTSSDTSTVVQQTNGFNFDEQFKQVRQLYEINDDPKRKEFLDELFSFMQKRGSPINRLPIMAKSVLDLYELYNLVIARGGLVEVINKKLWQEIIKGLHLPSSITSAAFTLRTQYMKYLYPFECEKKALSTPNELQAAIDGNRREGRRSNYGQFDSQMHEQIQQLQQAQRSPIPSSLQPQVSPLSLLTQQQNAHLLMAAAPQLGQMANIPQEIEQRIFDYLKMVQSQSMSELRRPPSPEIPVALPHPDALNALELSRAALWSMYQKEASPPFPTNGVLSNLAQRNMLKSPESPPRSIKRKREMMDYDNDCDSSIKKSVLGFGHHDRQFTDQLRNNRLRSESPGSQHSDDHALNISERHSTRVGASSSLSRNCSTGSSGSRNSSSGPVTLLSGMQFKVSQGKTANGEPQLTVSMELNGVHFEGLLLAIGGTATSSSTTPNTTSPPSTPIKIADSPQSVKSEPVDEPSTEQSVVPPMTLPAAEPPIVTASS